MYINVLCSVCLLLILAIDDALEIPLTHTPLLNLSITVSLDGKVARLDSLDPTVKVEASTASATAVTSDAKETAAPPEPPSCPGL